MARYKVVINTDSYKLKACSKKNWEAGTLNDFMVALNGWHSTENNLTELLFRLHMFTGRSFPDIAWDHEKEDYTDAYKKWISKKCNRITYLDRLCGFERTEEIKGYGFTQGYIDLDKVIEELKQNGSVKIPFEWLYDIRQYYKGMNGCYMEITKVK